MVHLLVVLVGGLLSMVAALLSTIGRGERSPESPVMPTFMAVFGCGLALTALSLSWMAWSESRNHLQVARTRITAYTEKGAKDPQKFVYTPLPDFMDAGNAPAQDGLRVWLLPDHSMA